MTASDLQEVRSQLPCLILGFQRLFCDAHIARGDYDACRAHLEILQTASLPGPARDEVLRSIRNALVAAELRPVVDDACARLSSRSRRLTRARFERTVEPLLLVIRGICGRNEMTAAGKATDAAVAECDRFAAAVIDAADHHLDYQSEQRERNLLYWMLLAKRLLQLPVSSVQRKRLEMVGADGVRHLYEDWNVGSDVQDPTACWFLDGESADPDASYVVDIHKVTSREVHADPASGTGGVQVGYAKRRVLVPRSRVARQLHTALPAGCWTVLLSVIAIIGFVVVHESGALDRLAAGYQLVRGSLGEADPRLREVLGALGPWFESGRGFIERGLGDMGVSGASIHPAALPFGATVLGSWLGLVWFRRLLRFFRTRRLRSKVARCTRRLASFTGGFSKRGWRRRRWNAKRKRLELTKRRCEARLARLEWPRKRRQLSKRLKPEASKEQFPSLEGAKSKGYRDGSEPTAKEMEMTPAEHRQALTMLQGGLHDLFRRLGM